MTMDGAYIPLVFDRCAETVEKMDRHPAAKKFDALIEEISELSSKKRQDYGTITDPFANVRGSEEWGIPGWVGAMVRANDKVRRLQKFAREGNLVNESVRDSFLDLAVYALIGLVLYEEEM